MIKHEDLQREFHEGIEPPPSPPFKFLLGWSRNYEGILSGDFETQTGVEELSLRAAETGRVLLTARGGAAKSVILRRVAVGICSAEVVPVFMDLSKWTALHYEEWKRCRDESSDQIHFILHQFSLPKVDAATLDVLPARVKRVLFVDGLNEVTSETAQQIILVLDDFVRYAVNSSVIVADRLVRRQLANPSRWQLATVLPLSSEEIDTQLDQGGRTGVLQKAKGSARELLSVPYFLNVTLKTGTSSPSSAQSIREYFVKHATLTEGDLIQASEAAFDAYKRERSRTFDFEAFSSKCGPEIVGKLKESGVLLADKKTASFKHHLKHDYLVSFYVKSHQQQWRPGTFDVVTFQASSFDALAMVLEQLPSTEEGDQFVRKLYDWNYYGAAYAIAESQQHQGAKVSDEMMTVVLAMLAERRWDLIEATAQRVTDALCLFPPMQAQRFLSVSSPEQLFQLVHELPTTKSWFHNWKDVFTKEPDTSLLDDQELRQIVNPDSILGWTYANVLKRFRLQLFDRHEVLLRSFATHQDATVRWRTAHVLGSFPSRGTCKILLRLLSDSNDWVRYGSVRSLIEMAALGEKSLRQMIFEQLAGRADLFSTNPRVLGEFQSAIFIRKDQAPRDWFSVVEYLIGILYRESSSAERHEWERIVRQLRDRYGTLEES